MFLWKIHKKHIWNAWREEDLETTRFLAAKNLLMFVSSRYSDAHSDSYSKKRKKRKGKITIFLLNKDTIKQIAFENVCRSSINFQIFGMLILLTDLHPMCRLILFGVNRSTREFFTHMETTLLPVKGSKFSPMLGTHGHWAVMVH